VTLVVFDLDGTLVDSRRDLADAANALLVDAGGAPLAEEAIGRMVGDGAATLVARVFEASGVAQPPDALARFLARYDSRLLAHTRPYPGIPEALTALAPRAPLAVLTNKPLAATKQILAGLDLARFFPEEFVIGGDGPFPRKPDPAGLLHLARRAGASARETILVGDSAIDWRTARNAGTRLCLVSYGFGFEGVEIETLRAGERVIDLPEELIQKA
jgi:phosphoglycolate phosphatase